VGPKEKHYLCVGFAIEIHEFSDDINIGGELQGKGRENIYFILGEGILFSRVGPGGTNLAATPELPAPAAAVTATQHGVGDTKTSHHRLADR
jgi:hypothetical protein